MITLDTIDSALHSIEVKSAAGNALNIDASGYITVKQGTSPWTVDGTVELGATTLAALENITVLQGTSPWVVSGTVELGATTLAALESITVVATDLDIRDLSHSQDSVKIGDGTDFLAINADGSINAQFVEGGYASWKTTKATVSNSSSQLVASALSGRVRIEIQNLGSADIYIKENNTSVLDGVKIPKGSSYEQALDNNATIYAITASGSSDVRIAEYAA